MGDGGFDGVVWTLGWLWLVFFDIWAGWAAGVWFWGILSAGRLDFRCDV